MKDIDNNISVAARIQEETWLQLKIMARKEGRTMNDLIGQALTEWLGFVRQAIKDKEQQELLHRVDGEIKATDDLEQKRQAEQEKRDLEEQAEIERMKLMRKKGRPVLDDKNKKWLKDKTGRLYRNRFWVGKDKASGKESG